MRHFYKKRHFAAMVFPILLLYLLFMVLPIGFDLVYSFTNYRALGTPKWIGLKNYERLFKDATLWLSMKNTLISTVMCTAIVVILSFFIAYTLDRKTKFNNLGKVIVFAPYIIPSALTALIWTFILSPTSGLLNGVLTSIGLESWTQIWINGPKLSPYSFAVVMSWSSMGFYMLIWQNGLSAIDSDVIEASVIDGCSRSQRVRHVILPLLTDTLISILIFSVVGGLKIYEVVVMMTGGGPMHKSESLVSYMYTTIFTGMEYGYGMAIAVMETLIAIVIVLIFLRNSRKNAD